MNHSLTCIISRYLIDDDFVVIHFQSLAIAFDRSTSDNRLCCLLSNSENSHLCQNLSAQPSGHVRQPIPERCSAYCRLDHRSFISLRQRGRFISARHSEKTRDGSEHPHHEPSGCRLSDGCLHDYHHLCRWLF